MRISDWSSDVCSYDLLDLGGEEEHVAGVATTEIELGDRVCQLRSTCATEPFDAHAGPHCEWVGRLLVVVVVDHDLDRHTALLEPVSLVQPPGERRQCRGVERSEEHTNELQSLMSSSYAVYCL